MAGSALLRQARREDALRLHELHTASVRTLCASHYAAEIIGGWLQNRSADGYLAPIKRGVLFVAEWDSRIIGFGEAAAGVVVAPRNVVRWKYPSCGWRLLIDAGRRISRGMRTMP